MDYRPLLKRVGIALVVVGLLDVALMVVAIMSRTSYSSSFNIFAVIAGIFLIKGSLRVASLVRQFVLFFLGALVSFAVVSPSVVPPGYLLVQLQLNPMAIIGSLAGLVLVVGFFLWLVRELGSSVVLQARQEAGLPPRRGLVPFYIGVGLAGLLAISSYFVQHSESANRATSEARTALGEDYSFYVSSISFRTSSEGKAVSGIVTAWKSGSIKEHRFSWRE